MQERNKRIVSDGGISFIEETDIIVKYISIIRESYAKYANYKKIANVFYKKDIK